MEVVSMGEGDSDLGKRSADDSEECRKRLRTQNEIQTAIEQCRRNNTEAEQQSFEINQALEGVLARHCIPYLTDSSVPYLPATPELVGDEHKQLAALVHKSCFQAVDVQHARVVAVVQPYGSGKTRYMLSLSERFHVLCLRFMTESPLLMALVRAQDSRYQPLKGREVLLQEVQDFSDTCMRLAHLSLLSLVAFLDDCIERKFIDPQNAMDRFYLALLMVQPDRNIEQWLAGWFQEHAHFCEDRDRFDELRAQLFSTERTQSRGCEIVIALDEVHTTMKMLRGYVLHVNDDDGGDTDDLVAGWRSEVENGQNRSGARCTDLFYQYCAVFLTYLQTKQLSFVMCSTLFRIWDQLDADQSPLARGVIERFTDLHYLKPEEVAATIQRYFLVPLEVFADEDMQVRLSKFSRPLYLAELLEGLKLYLLAVVVGGLTLLHGLVLDAVELAPDVADLVVDRSNARVDLFCGHH